MSRKFRLNRGKFGLGGGGGINYQIQIVQSYQLPTPFFGGGGGGSKLPNANGPNLSTTNSFLGVGWGGKLPNANGPNLPTTNSFLGGGVNYQMQGSILNNYQLISVIDIGPSDCMQQLSNC